MSGESLLDWLLMMLTFAASWQMYGAVAPLLEVEDQPDAGLSRASLGSICPPPGSRLDATLQRIGEAGGYADLGRFLAGAQQSYEEVVRAFVAGRLGTVAHLVSEEVRTAFALVIAAREARGDVQSATLVALSAEPVDAGIDGGLAWVAVRFAAERVAVTFGSGGQVVDGDPRHVGHTCEIWTFARPLAGRDPTWLVVATGEGTS